MLIYIGFSETGNLTEILGIFDVWKLLKYHISDCIYMTFPALKYLCPCALLVLSKLWHISCNCRTRKNPAYLHFYNMKSCECTHPYLFQQNDYTLNSNACYIKNIFLFPNKCYQEIIIFHISVITFFHCKFLLFRTFCVQFTLARAS